MQAEILRTLFGIQRQLTEFRQLQPLLDYALEASLILFSADTCSILLLHEDGKKEYLTTHSSEGTPLEIVDRPILEWVSQTRAVLPAPDESLAQAPVTIAAPLLFWGQLQGAICLTRTTEPAFTPDDVALLQLFTEHLTVVIENARLNEMTATLVATQEAMLRDLKKQMKPVSTLVRRDLREPLSVIASFASLLEEYSGSLNVTEQKLVARTIQRMATRMDELSVHLLQVAGVEKPESALETAVTPIHASIDTKPLNIAVLPV